MSKTDWKSVEGTVVSVTSTYPRGRVQYTVAFTYKVDGHLYDGTFYTFDATHEGDSLAVRYNVSNPGRSNLGEKQKRIGRIAIAVPFVGFILFLLWFSLSK